MKVARGWESQITKGKPTGQIERLQQLCELVFGRPLFTLAGDVSVKTDAFLADLPYQLSADSPERSRSP